MSTATLDQPKAVAVRERPILFSTPMVRAILDGRKSQTRRVVQYRASGPNPPDAGNPHTWDFYRGEKWVGAVSERDPDTFSIPCPYGKPGDRLWVRETWAETTARTAADWRAAGDAWDRFRSGQQSLADAALSIPPASGERHALYRADFPEDEGMGFSWRPSIHMPRWACRLTLELTDVRVERLQEISEEGARAEGISEKCHGCEPGVCQQIGPACSVFAYSQVQGFRRLWDGLNVARGYGWDTSPWVWVVSFALVLPGARAGGGE